MRLFACGANALWQLCPEEAILEGVGLDSDDAKRQNLKDIQETSKGSDEDRMNLESATEDDFARHMASVDGLRVKRNRRADLKEFRQILSDLQIEDEFGDKAFDRLQVLFVSFGCTAVVVNNYTIFILGFNPFNPSKLHPRTIYIGHRPGFLYSGVPQPLSCAFGDHNGLLGAIDPYGSIWTEDREDLEYVLKLVGREFMANDIRVSLVALCGNGRVAAVLRPPSKFHFMSEVLEFANLGTHPELAHSAQGDKDVPKFGNPKPPRRSFLRWYWNPHDPHEQPPSKSIITGVVKQLKANNTSFTLLTNNGDVYTWGDSRYPACLGRVPTIEQPADKPNPVEGVTGLKIVHITSGGWFTGVVTDAGDIWMWGASPKGLDLFGNTVDASDPAVRVDLMPRDSIAPSIASARVGTEESIDKSPDTETKTEHEVEAEAEEDDAERRPTSPDPTAESGMDTEMMQAASGGTPPSSPPAIVLSSPTRAKSPSKPGASVDAGSEHSSSMDGEIRIIDLAIGEKHAIALEKCGAVWVVGDNSHGQLGLGDKELPNNFSKRWRIAETFFEDGLREQEIEGRAHRVHAGPYSSFVVVGPSERLRNDPDFGELGYGDYK